MWSIGRERENSIVEEFIEYLEGKRIDALAFKKSDEILFTTWEREFMQMHPKSFTSQKLYLINNIRKQYLLPEDRVKQIVKKVKTVAKVSVGSKVKIGEEKKKPSMKPKISIARPAPKSTNEVGGPVEKEMKKDNPKPKMVIKKPIVKSKLVDEEGVKVDLKEELTPKVASMNTGVLKPKIGLKKPVVKPKSLLKEGITEQKKNPTPKIPSVLKPKIVIKKNED